MKQLFANNAATVLAQSLTSAATTLTVSNGNVFPQPGVDEFFLVTLSGFDSNGNEDVWEIVKCTGRVGNVLTIERAQEGTVARAWATASRVELRLTAGTMAGVGDVTTTGVQTLENKTIVGLKETRVLMETSDIDLNAGNFFVKTVAGNLTFSVSNVPTAGTSSSFLLELTNAGSATITWWAGVKWAGGVAPTLTVAGRDVLGFYTHDNGTTWTGLVLGVDVK